MSQSRHAWSHSNEPNSKSLTAVALSGATMLFAIPAVAQVARDIRR